MLQRYFLAGDLTYLVPPGLNRFQCGRERPECSLGPETSVLCSEKSMDHLEIFKTLFCFTQCMESSFLFEFCLLLGNDKEIEDP
jgi:hypothetical protein